MKIGELLKSEFIGPFNTIMITFDNCDLAYLGTAMDTPVDTIPDYDIANVCAISKSDAKIIANCCYIAQVNSDDYCCGYHEKTEEFMNSYALDENNKLVSAIMWIRLNRLRGMQ